MSNQAIEKLSPFKNLTDEQAQLVDEVILFAKQHLTQDFPAVYTILGDAGTGKSASSRTCLLVCSRPPGFSQTVLFTGRTTIFWSTIPKSSKSTNRLPDRSKLC